MEEEASWKLNSGTVPATRDYVWTRISFCSHQRHLPRNLPMYIKLIIKIKNQIIINTVHMN